MNWIWQQKIRYGKSGNTYYTYNDDNYTINNTTKIEDIYFNYTQCFDGICYQYVIDTFDIYNTSLMTGDGYSINNMYNEYNVIDEYLPNIYMVDVATNEKINFNNSHHKLDNTKLKIGHKILIFDQNDATKNDIYIIDKNYMLINSDLLTERDKSFRAKIVPNIGDNAHKQYFLNNVGNQFPIKGEEKTFTVAHSYIVKNKIDYDIFNTALTYEYDVSGNSISNPNKILFTNYKAARTMSETNNWNSINIPLSPFPISVKYLNYEFNINNTGIIYTEDTNGIENISGETILNITNANTLYSVGDSLSLNLKHGIAGFSGWEFEPTNSDFNLLTTVKEVTSSTLTLNNTIPDWILDDFYTSYRYRLRNIHYTDNISEYYDYFNISPFGEILKFNSGSTLTIEVDETSDHFKYFDYNLITFEHNALSYNLTTENQYQNYKLLPFLNDLSNVPNDVPNIVYDTFSLSSFDVTIEEIFDYQNDEHSQNPTNDYYPIQSSRYKITPNDKSVLKHFKPYTYINYVDGNISFNFVYDVDGGDTITLPFNGTNLFVSIDWGDGWIDDQSNFNVTSQNPTHQYSASGLYTIKVIGSFTKLQYSLNPNGKLKLKEVYLYSAIPVDYLDFSNCENMEICNLSQIKTTQTSMSYMFNNCEKLIDLDFGNDFNTSVLTNMKSMLRNCQSLTTLNFGDNFDTSNVTNMSTMFFNCQSIINLNLTNFDTSNVTDMKYMFYNCSSLTSLEIINFDTSNVTNMSYMFRDCNSLISLDLGDNFNTSNVINMSLMFYNCNSLDTFDLGTHFDTSNVTDMTFMFYNCQSLTSLDLGNNFNTSNVTNISNIFNGCQSLTTLELGDNFDTSNVTDMSSMFSYCQSLTTLNFGDNFDTSNVTDMSSMFSYCQSLTSLDLGDNFNTSNVTDMKYMFYNCQSLTSLDLVDNFNTNLATNMTNMFYNCFHLQCIKTQNFDTTLPSLDKSQMFVNCIIMQYPTQLKRNELTSMSGSIYTFDYCGVTPSIFIYNDVVSNDIIELPLTFSVNFSVDWGDGNVTHNLTSHTYTTNNNYTIKVYGDYEELNYNIVPSNRDKLNSVQLHNTSLTTLSFRNCSNLESCILNVDTVGITNMSLMFYNCNSLTTLELGNNFNTSNATNMSNMFSECLDLSSLDLSSFNTSAVTNMIYMFYNCQSLTSLDLGTHFDTSNVTDIYCMFYNCNSLISLDLGDNFNTNLATNMTNMFFNCNSLTTLNLVDNFYTSAVTNMKSMFGYCQSLTSLDLGDYFNTSNVTDMKYMFFNCPNLTSLELGDNFYTTSVTNMSYMFGYCNSLTSLDLGTHFNTSNVTNMSYMFYNSQSLTSLDLSGFNTSAVTTVNSMFNNCINIQTINIDEFDQITDMSNLFKNCSHLTCILSNKIDTNGINTTDMFDGCTLLTKPDSQQQTDLINGDIYHSSNCFESNDFDYNIIWNNTQITIPFNGTNNFIINWGDGSAEETITTPNPVHTFTNSGTYTVKVYGTFDELNYNITLNTQDRNRLISVKFAEQTLTVLKFYHCKNMTNCDIRKINTSQMPHMISMFEGCEDLICISADNFNTTTVVNKSYMFDNCTSLLHPTSAEQTDLTDSNGGIYTYDCP